MKPTVRQGSGLGCSCSLFAKRSPPRKPPEAVAIGSIWSTSGCEGWAIHMIRKPLSAPARAIVAAQLSRRRVLQHAGALGAATILAGCSVRGDDTSDSGRSNVAAADDESDTDKTVRWANWPEYLDYDDQAQVYPSLQAFQSATGIKATYAEDIEDHSAYYGKILPKLKKGEDVGQDIITLGDAVAARMIPLGYAQRLNDTNIPNKSNILPNLSNVEFDPGREYSVTWQSYMTGIAWSKEKIPEGLRRVSDLWQGHWHGGVEVVSDMRDAVGLLMLDAGVDISSNDWGDNEFLAALDVLQKQLDTGQIRQVKGASYLDDLISGDAIAAIAWSGDITQINLEHGDRWSFTIPEGGGVMGSDNLLIPVGSPHKKNAEMLMNHYYDPAIAAEVAAYVQYVTPVHGAKEEMAKIDPGLVENPLIFPTKEFLQNLKVFRPLTPEEDQNYTVEFIKVLGN
jgi:spermidine/putrescine transport system substrate-binding protein